MGCGCRRSLGRRSRGCLWTVPSTLTADPASGWQSPGGGKPTARLDPGGRMDRSSRRRAQLLVASALLGATLGLVAETAQTPGRSRPRRSETEQQASGRARRAADRQPPGRPLPNRRPPAAPRLGSRRRTARGTGRSPATTGRPSPARATTSRARATTGSRPLPARSAGIGLAVRRVGLPTAGQAGADQHDAGQLLDRRPPGRGA
jgi:hypothetical protein